MRCVRIATARVEELTAQLRAALKGQEVARLASRVRRHGGVPDTTPAPVGELLHPVGCSHIQSSVTLNCCALGSREDAAKEFVAASAVSRSPHPLRGAGGVRKACVPWRSPSSYAHR